MQIVGNFCMKFVDFNIVWYALVPSKSLVATQNLELIPLNIFYVYRQRLTWLTMYETQIKRVRHFFDIKKWIVVDVGYNKKPFVPFVWSNKRGLMIKDIWHCFFIYSCCFLSMLSMDHISYQSVFSFHAG